ncbi:hypothetical protein L9F63_006593, partial [Diploptera punctata]
ITILLALFAIASAFPGHVEENESHDVHPQYKFEYAVHDPHSGDVKDQWEVRDGDKVKGAYSVKESDGKTRTVEYYSDKHNGFIAVVKKSGGYGKPEITYHGAKPYN